MLGYDGDFKLLILKIAVPWGKRNERLAEQTRFSSTQVVRPMLGLGRHRRTVIDTACFASGVELAKIIINRVIVNYCES